MATTKRYVKREELVAFLNIGGETADFELIGNGQSTLTYEYNAATETEHYIADALPTTIVDLDAAVGPESGTISVFGASKITSSIPTSSVDATIFLKAVLKPWPISV